MKEFNLDKLERQNIFTHKEDFFAEMQNKVLAEIPQEKAGKVFKLNWAYTAAAAVTLLFGFTFFLTSAPAETPSVAQNEVEIKNTVSAAEQATAPSEEAIALKVLEEDLTSLENSNPKNTAAQKTKFTGETAKFAKQNEKEQVKTAEVQVDQILSNFTRAEIADLSQNAEQDIYLDLYN